VGALESELQSDNVKEVGKLSSPNRSKVARLWVADLVVGQVDLWGMQALGLGQAVVALILDQVGNQAFHLPTRRRGALVQFLHRVEPALAQDLGRLLAAWGVGIALPRRNKSLLAFTPGGLASPAFGGLPLGVREELFPGGVKVAGGLRG